MEDREAKVRERVGGEKDDEKHVNEFLKMHLVEDGLVLKLVLLEIVAGIRNRNAELDAEVLVELALPAIHLEVLVLGNAFEEVLELKCEIRF